MRVRFLMLAGAAFAGFVLAGGESALGADYPVLRGSQVEEAPSRRDFDSGQANWGGLYFGGTVGYSSGQFDARPQSEQLSQQAFNQLLVRPYGVDLVRLGKSGSDKTSFGGFVGYNVQFSDVVLGVELDYQRANLAASETKIEGRTFSNVIPGIAPTTLGSESAGTETTIAVGARSANRLEDYGVAKIRAGYAFGNVLPFVTLGAALGRIRSDGRVAQGNVTVENVNNYQVLSNVDPITGAVTLSRGPFTGRTSSVIDSGSSSAGTPKSGYAAGLAIGGGVDALLGDNILLRAEVQRVYFTEYKGVQTVVDTARIGAGLKF